MKDDLLNQFTAKWRDLSAKLDLDEPQSALICSYLLKQYGGDDRHYHNVRHIVSMLDGFERLRDKFKKPLAAELAIFFHDAIYDASRPDNEEQSALQMKKMLVGKVDQAIVADAAFSIEATKKHAATPSHDTNLILDLDMAILGQPWAVYEQYAKGVMQEFVPVYGEAAYRQGRPAMFLEPTIKHSDVFLTDNFKHLNGQAIKNMEREKEILLSGRPFGGMELA